MKHWHVLEWSDFVKGVAADGEAMRRHLADGCVECGETVAQLELFAVDSASQLDPPEHLVVGALAVQAMKSQAPDSSDRWVPLRLVFDSLSQPMTAGIRAAPGAHRHLVFSSREFTLDARLEGDGSQEELSVVGQIVARGGSPVVEVPAFLLAGEEIVSQARSSRLGEFQMTCRRIRGLRICLSLPDRRLIGVDLDRQPEAPRRG